MHKILPLLLLTMTLLFSSQMATVSGLDPNGDGFLSLRKKPKAKEIGKLYNGDRVKILDRTGKYYKVKAIKSGKIGWAHRNWIKKGHSTSSKKLHVIRISSNDTLSVRKNAGIHNKKIGDLTYDASGIRKIKCKNAPSGKRWCKVSHSSIPTGWVMAKYISSKSKSSSNTTNSHSSHTNNRNSRSTHKNRYIIKLGNDAPSYDYDKYTVWYKPYISINDGTHVWSKVLRQSGCYQLLVGSNDSNIYGNCSNCSNNIQSYWSCSARGSGSFSINGNPIKATNDIVKRSR